MGNFGSVIKGKYVPVPVSRGLSFLGLRVLVSLRFLGLRFLGVFVF